MQVMKFALRSLSRTPIVSAVAILSLALGIGANTAMFSLVNSLVLRALPVHDPERLVIVTEASASGAQSWTFAIWDNIRQRAQAFDGACAWSMQRFNLAERGETRPVDGMYVSGDYFSTLGVSAFIGRTIAAEDDVRGGGVDGPVAVISYAFWQRYFGGVSDIIGRTLTVERVRYTVIGVTPPSFLGAEIGRTFDVAVPLGTEPLVRGAESALDRRSYWWLTIMLRRQPQQSLDAATTALRAIQPQVREASMPEEFLPSLRARFLTEPLVILPAATGTSSLRARYERPLLAILAVVALVLLIACANIANLLLARTTARRHELSVKRALGASPWRVARQLLVESLLLSVAGAAAGLLLAAGGSRALVAQLSTTVNRVAIDLSLDWRVLAFTAAVTIATTIVFGVAPAFSAARVAPSDALKEHGRGTTSARHGGVSSALVIVQVALSLVLVVAAALFVRTFAGLASVPLGFAPDGVLVTNVNLSRSRVAIENRPRLVSDLTSAASAVPRVTGAAASVVTPVSGSTWNYNVRVPGAPDLPDNEQNSLINVITPGWFATYGTRIVAGRDLDARDNESALPVALVNEAFVRRFLPGREPLGAIVEFPSLTSQAQPSRQIVGVVEDAVYRNLREPLRPTLYQPLAQVGAIPRVPLAAASISVRVAAGSPLAASRSIADALARVDRDVTFAFRPLSDQVSASLTQERLVASLAGFFGALALLLAGLGLYGLTAYSANRRRTEIGIRLALGAEPAGVVRLMWLRAAALVGMGIALGTALSVWSLKFIAPLLFQLDPRDTSTLAGAALTLAIVGGIAGWLPAHRASRLDAAAVLREG